MFSRISFFKSNKVDESAGGNSEPDMKCCPECGDEYRPEFNHCAICKIELISAASEKNKHSRTDNKKKNRSLHISPEDELVTLRRGSLVDIKDLQRLLKAESIGSLLVEDRSGGNSGCGNAKTFDLRVKAEYAVDAQQLLADDFKRSTALDSHDFQQEAGAVFDERSTEARCPACGCHFQTSDRTCPECGLCF